MNTIQTIFHIFKITSHIDQNLKNIIKIQNISKQYKTIIHHHQTLFY